MPWTTWRDVPPGGGPRLAFYYACLFAVGSAGGLALLYLLVAIYTLQALDSDLATKARELRPHVAEARVEPLGAILAADALAHGQGNWLYVLRDPDWHVLARAGGRDWALPPADLLEGTSGPHEDRYTLQTVALMRAGRPHSVRLISVRFTNGRILQMGTDMSGRERLLMLLRNTAGIVWLVMLCMAGLVGRAVARQIGGGVRQVTRALQRVADGLPVERVDTSGAGGEAEYLARAFNLMTDRMDVRNREMRQANDDLTHDLRSPITRIRGLAELAITPRRGAAADTVEGLGSIVEECDRMLNLITTMLDISESEAGIGRASVEVFDLRTVVDQAVDLFQMVAEEKHLVLRAETRVEAWVKGDRRRIQRVLSNLVDNALKYTEKGEVVVALVEENGLARLSVRDTGVGLAESEVTRVFERFYRCDRSRNQPGNGLGLSLARAIARAHGGEILVVSTPGLGSEFTVVLPTLRSPAGGGPPN